MEIFVKNLRFVGKHGVYAEEKRDGRRFVVDVVLTLIEDNPVDDASLASTLDYREIASVVLKHGLGPSVNLIETLVDRILEDLVNLSDTITAADVTIHKAATGVPGDPEWVGVHKVRRVTRS